MSNTPSSASEEDGTRELFSALLAQIDTSCLSTLAATVRQRVQPDIDKKPPTIEGPLFGSFHALLPILFGDGTRWLAKFPISGATEKWDDLSSRSLSAEAKTMLLFKRETTIPVPEVYDFSATTDNDLNCPYILMSFLPGKPLYDVWFGHHLRGVSLEDQRNHRTRILDDIAGAMVQLGRFSFKTGGFLNFDAEGNPSGTGPRRFLDGQAMLDRWFIHQDPADDPIYVECPELNDPKDHYLFFMNLHPTESPFGRGLQSLLEHMINWIPEATSPDEQFVLAHPDFDVQNFLVSDSGELQGIIDWDNVAAVPKSIGNEGYPGWLTRDWDPLMYGYKESMEAGVEPDGVWEDSPAELAYYRKLYRDIMSVKLRQSLGSTEGSCPRWTRASLIADNLSIAAHNARCRQDIVIKVVKEVAASSKGCAEVEFLDLVDDLAEDCMEESTLGELKEGFLKLLDDCN